MTFPAWDRFDADRRVKARHLGVYRVCRKTFDFVEIRDKKLQTIADESGVHLTQVSKVLDALVAWGYLVEHERGKFGERRFTLTWSVREGVAPLATGEAVG
jgi:hypothetical protein